MNRSDAELYDFVFPFRRVFSFEIDDLKKLETEGYWASVNFGYYNFDLKINFFEPPGIEEAYLSSYAFLSRDDQENFDYWPGIDIPHRLRVINKRTSADYVTTWDEYEMFKFDDTRCEPFKILDRGTLLSDGYAENGSISFEWELNIQSCSVPLSPSCYFSVRKLRVHRVWCRPTFKKGLKVRTERIEKDVLFKDIDDKEYSLSDTLKISTWEFNLITKMEFMAKTPRKLGRVLLEVFISCPPIKLYKVMHLHRRPTTELVIREPWCKSKLHENSELHIEIYLHELESPINTISLAPKANDDDKFLVLIDGYIETRFFKSPLMNYSKLVHDFFTKKSFRGNIFSTKNTDLFFRKLKDIYEFKLLCPYQRIEYLFFNFAMLIHNREVDILGMSIIDECIIKDFLLLIEVLDSPEGFRRCDALMTEKKFENDLEILKLVAQYPLPQMKAFYKKKYQDVFEWRKLMQNENFKSLPPEFVEDLAKNHDNEIECNVTLRYDSSDSNWQSTFEADQVVISDFKTGEEYIVNKMILAIASDYFWMRFFGPHSHRDDKYVVFDDGIPGNFLPFLNYIYHPTNPITHHNFDALLEMAHRFDAYKLLYKLEKFLVFNENYSLPDKLKYSNDFDLVFVLEFCLNSVKCFDDLEKLKKDEKFIQLPAEFKEFVQENIRWRIVTFV